MQVDLCCCFRSQGAAICPVRCPRARCAVAAVPGRCFHHGALPWRVGVRTHGAASWPPLACSSSRCRWLPQQQFSSKRQAQNPRTLAHPFVILLELREKEKPRGLFLFYLRLAPHRLSPRAAGGSRLLWECCECLHGNRAGSAPGTLLEAAALVLGVSEPLCGVRAPSGGETWRRGIYAGQQAAAV